MSDGRSDLWCLFLQEDQSIENISKKNIFE